MISDRWWISKLIKLISRLFRSMSRKQLSSIVNLAYAELAKENIIQAKQLYKEAILLDPKNPELWTKKSVCNVKLKLFGAAGMRYQIYISHFCSSFSVWDATKALKLKPNSVEGYLFFCA